MSQNTIQTKIEQVRNETQQYGNTRGRVADLLTMLNTEKLDRDGALALLAEISSIAPEFLEYVKAGHFVIDADAGFGGDLVVADDPDPTKPTWYFAKESGTYTNAGGLVVDLSGKLVILNYDGTTWSMIETLAVEGLSAYEVAVANGFVGTEAEWLDSLGGKVEGLEDEVRNFTFADFYEPSAEFRASDGVIVGGPYPGVFRTALIPIKKGDIIDFLFKGHYIGVDEYRANIVFFDEAQAPIRGVFKKDTLFSNFNYISPYDGFVLFTMQTSANNADTAVTITTKSKYLTTENIDEFLKGTQINGSRAEVPKPKTLVKLFWETESNFVIGDDENKVINGKVTLVFDNLRIVKFAKVKWQGSSSLVYPKKNLTFSLFNDEAYTDSFKLSINSMVYHDEWVFKADWIDASHVRNIASNRLWEGMIQAREGYPKREVEVVYNTTVAKDSYDTGALGHVDGFPCVVYMNDVFYGIGNFNIGKKRDNYNQQKTNKKHICLSASHHSDMYSFNPATWELRNPTVAGYTEGAVITDSDVMTDINRLFGFNNANAVDFKAGFSQHYNLTNAIDYYILMYILDGIDIVDKNFLLTTWDGLIWNFMPYDLDTTFGLFWNGAEILPTNHVVETFVDLNSNAKLFWQKFFTAFSVEIKARYSSLRLKVLTQDNLYTIIKDLEPKFLKYYSDQEFTKWVDIPSKNITSASQVITWFGGRLAFLDANKFN